jgi:hypothetical protein
MILLYVLCGESVLIGVPLGRAMVGATERMSTSAVTRTAFSFFPLSTAFGTRTIAVADGLTDPAAVAEFAGAITKVAGSDCAAG